MPNVRYTGGGTYHVDGHTYHSGDEHDVSEGLASHLVSDVGDFEYANATDVEYTAVEPDPEPEEKTCAGNDGDCSRPVSEDETYCWQHP